MSTRSGDELVKALGMSGVSKNQVSRLCGELDERVGAFLNRQIEGDWPYLWIDATYVNTREAGRIVSVAVIVAVRVHTEGQREVLGLKVGPSEAEPFWSDFLRSLNRRGLRGVKLVISDSQDGIKAAASNVLKATWQRCRVHFMRNALVHTGKTQRRMVSAAIATVFVRETADIAKTQWRSVADQLRSKFPKLGTLMDEAENDMLAFMTFPRAHPASERAANIISLIESAKLNAHDPWAYLKDAFERLPTLKNTDLASILPHNWQPPARATVPGVAHQSVAAATTL